MSNTGEAVVDDVPESSRMAARHADLIIAHHAAQQRIAELEAIAAHSNGSGPHRRGSDGSDNSDNAHEGYDGRPTVPLRRRLSAPLLDQPFKKDGMRRITEFNAELVETINDLRMSIIKMERDAHVQLILLSDEVEHLRAEKDALRRENDALKERVADDVLRQRQANRVEMALEKARIAARTLAVGTRCLENTEAILMEKNDDMYYIQRYDAVKLPVRDVTFVVHIAAGVSYPLSDAEEFTMNMYRKLLYNTARQHGGYYVSSVQNIDVFALQSATVAVRFARDCHTILLDTPWLPRTSGIPSFAPLIDSGNKLFNGPRLHTCLFTVANPGSEVDPVTGRSIYFGPEIREAIHSAITGAPIGEIVANAAWGELLVRESRVLKDEIPSTAAPNTHIADGPDVPEVRARLGPLWCVIAARSPVQSLRYSILPLSLEGRRGLPPYLLHPTERLPHIDAADALLQDTLRAIKGIARLARGPQENWVEGFARRDAGALGSGSSVRSAGSAGNSGDAAGENLALYSLHREHEYMLRLYRWMETACARHEQDAMAAEDRYTARCGVIDTTEMAFVCTVDTGTGDAWRALLASDSIGNGAAALSHDDETQLREELIAAVYASGWKCNGTIINGDATRVFTYAFRQPAQVFEFSAQVYTAVEERVEKLSRSREICANHSLSATTTGIHDEPSSDAPVLSIMRAGIAFGALLPFELPKSPFGVSGATLCRGPVVSVSGALCDMARCGEILATADAIQAFYATRTNLASMAYNVLRLGCRFFGPVTDAIDVCSVLPKAFAARRKVPMAGPYVGEDIPMPPIDIVDNNSISIKSLNASMMNSSNNNNNNNNNNSNNMMHARKTSSVGRKKNAGVPSPSGKQSKKYANSTNNNTGELITAVPRLAVREAQITRSARAALCLDAPLLSRAEVSALLEQQRRMMERAEAATMASHDTAWDLTVKQQLSMAWPLSGAADVRRAELGFFYCDAAGVPRLVAELPPDLCADVLAHYNYIVQSALLVHGGVVARTDGISAYIALFPDPHAALEAAVTVQRELLAAEWPARLHTLEETLHVRSAASGTLLFRGVRAAVAVHSSTAYAKDASGAALGTVVVLGRAARGGEVLVALPALARVSASLSGSLLLQQLDSRAAASVAETAGVTAASCVLRAAAERHGLLAAAPGALAGTGEGAGGGARDAEGAWFDASGAAAALPPARHAPWASEAAAVTSKDTVDVVRDADALATLIKREAATGVVTNVFREGFLAIARHTLTGFAAAYRALDDAVTKTDAAKEAATAQQPQPITATIRQRSIGDASRKAASNRAIISQGALQDPFRAVLHNFDTTLRTAQLQSSSILAGGMMQPPAGKKLTGRPPPRRATQNH